MLNLTLTKMLTTISMIVLQRQNIHNELSERNEWNDNYDYIIVGAGSAGSVVAERLSENYNIKVLLLEAGGPQTVISDMPGMLIANKK